MTHNTQIVYVKPPADGALPDPVGTFTVVHTPFDTEAANLKPGEVLVENQYLSIVVRSANPEFAVGDLLYSWVRRERFTVVDEPNLQYLQKVQPGVDPVHYLGPLGAPGLTAYAGITQIGKPRPTWSGEDTRRRPDPDEPRRADLDRWHGLPIQPAARPALPTEEPASSVLRHVQG
jgi:hypothetical protein